MSLLQTGTGRVDCKKCNLQEIVLFYMSYQIVEHGAKAKISSDKYISEL